MTRDQFFAMLDQHAGVGVRYDLARNQGNLALFVAGGVGEPWTERNQKPFDLEPYHGYGDPADLYTLYEKYRGWLADWRRERRGKKQ